MRPLDDDQVGKSMEEQLLDEFEVEKPEDMFLLRLAQTGNPELAARGTIVPVDASSRLAKLTAEKALQDTGVHARFMDYMEQADIKPVDIFQTLARNMKSRKYALWQKTGEAIDIGPDSMGQISAAKTLLQGMGMINGGVKDVIPEKKEEEPKSVHLHFHQRPLDDGEDDDDPIIIDGDPLVSE